MLDKTTVVTEKLFRSLQPLNGKVNLKFGKYELQKKNLRNLFSLKLFAPIKSKTPVVLHFVHHLYIVLFFSEVSAEIFTPSFTPGRVI